MCYELVQLNAFFSCFAVVRLTTVLPLSYCIVCAFEAEARSLSGMIEEWWWDSYTGPLVDVPKAVARLDVAAVVVHDLW